MTLAPGATSFTVEFVVDSVVNANAIQFNGFFLGVVSGLDATLGGTDAINGLFNNNPAAVGIRVFTNSTSNPSFSLVEDEICTSPSTLFGCGSFGLQFNEPLAPTSTGGVMPTAASIEDGFTITFTVSNDDTVTASSTGLSSDINFSGTLTLASTTFAAIQSDLGISISAQGADVGLNIGSVTLTAIHPTTGLLGDVNLDGFVDFFDIQPLIGLLINQTFQFEGDVNGDGSVDFLDIQPFINILSDQGP